MRNNVNRFTSMLRVNELGDDLGVLINEPINLYAMTSM